MTTRIDEIIASKTMFEVLESIERLTGRIDEIVKMERVIETGTFHFFGIRVENPEIDMNIADSGKHSDQLKLIAVDLLKTRKETLQSLLDKHAKRLEFLTAESTTSLKSA